MSLLDNELELGKTSFQRKWALCIYCTMPFLALKSEKSCKRCTHFVQYDKNRKHRYMLFFFVTNTVVGIGQSYIASFISQYTNNSTLIMLLLVFFVFVFGSILWKIIKKIDI